MPYNRESPYPMDYPDTATDGLMDVGWLARARASDKGSAYLQYL